MKRVNVAEVRRELPSLVDEVIESQQDIVITRRGKPVAKLVPYQEDKARGDRYPLRGKPIWISEDFDEPMTELWEVMSQ